MISLRKSVSLAMVIGYAGAAVLLIPGGAASRAPQGNEPTPAYHSQVPDGPLPQTMAPSSFANPVIQNAYAVAAKVKRALYQQPCYCHCDRSIGHESLLDCYVGKHASVCDVCMREAFYTYEQTQKKKSAAEIRAGIERGEWQQVDTSKYETYPAK